MTIETGAPPSFIQAAADADARYHEGYRVAEQAADELSADQKEMLIERLQKQLEEFHAQWGGRR